MKKNKYGIGFSLTNTSAGDVFDKSLGIASALTRALGYQGSPKVPESIIPEFMKFLERSGAYFKDLKLHNCPSLRQ